MKRHYGLAALFVGVVLLAQLPKSGGGGGGAAGKAGGDLSGTYPDPTVAKVGGIGISSAGVTVGQAFVYDGASFIPASIAPKPGNTKLQSASVLLINDGCSAGDPCNLRSGDSTFTFTSSATATITAGSGSGSAKVYMTSAGAIVVSHPTAAGLSVTCTGCTQLQTATPAVPTGGIALYNVTVTSGAWASIVDVRTFIGGGVNPAGPALFSSTATATVANTSSETTIIGSGIGTLTLPANYFQEGTNLKVVASGYLSTDAVPGTIRIRLKFGSTVILDTGAVTPTAAMTNEGWQLSALVTCRTTGATGTVIANTALTRGDGATAAAFQWKMVNTSTVTIDTTVTQAVGLTVEWQTADVDNSISGSNFSMATFGGGMPTPPNFAFYYNYKAAICQAAAASLGFAYSSNPPLAACVTGTNSVYGVAQFPDTDVVHGMQDHFSLAGWDGSPISLTFTWRVNATSGNVVWQVQTACVASGEVGDPSWNTATTVTDAALGTANWWNAAAITSVTVTGCAVSEELLFRVFRDRAHASDTLGAVAPELIGVNWKLRRVLGE